LHGWIEHGVAQFQTLGHKTHLSLMNQKKIRDLFVSVIIIISMSWYMSYKRQQGKIAAWELVNVYAGILKPTVRYLPYGERGNIMGQTYFFRPDVYDTQSGLKIEAPLFGKPKLTLIENNFEDIAQPKH